MPESMTLRCEAGHDWQRPSQRGRPPRFCPDHQPVAKTKATKTYSKSDQQQKMQAGRERARAERRKSSKSKVDAFRKWLPKDRAWWNKLESGNITREEYYRDRPEMPIVPEASDYAAARGEEV